MHWDKLKIKCQIFVDGGEGHAQKHPNKQKFAVLRDPPLLEPHSRHRSYPPIIVLAEFIHVYCIPCIQDFPSSPSARASKGILHTNIYPVIQNTKEFADRNYNVATCD